MKALLILDAATEVPAIAFRMDEPTNAAITEPQSGAAAVHGGMLSAGLLARAGYGRTDADHHSYVCLIRADGACFRAETDPFAWDNLTMTCAHRWLLDHLEEHPHGGAIDVEPMRLAMTGAETCTPEHDGPAGYLPDAVSLLDGEAR